MGPKVRRTTIWRRELAIFLAIIVWGVGTSSAPAADPARGVEILERAGLYAGPVPVHFIVIAQIAQPKAKDSWLRKAWRSPSKRLWIFVVGGVIVLSVVVGGWYLVEANKKKRPKLQVTESQIGPYRLQNLLATGHTSQVWEVVELSSHLHYAMKLLLPENVYNPVHRQLLFHEAEVGRILAHPNIIKIRTVMKDPEHPFFIMEFFPSGSLKLRIMRKEKAFIQEKVHDIFKQTMTGLAYMHASGWVHRDIKPENILCNSAGEVRIIDFAISQRIPNTGRPPFRGGSPEALLNKHLFEKPVSPEVYNPDVTKEFGEFILRMLAKRREERPNNFHEALMQFRNIKVFKTPAVKKEESK